MILAALTPVAAVALEHWVHPGPADQVARVVPAQSARLAGRLRAVLRAAHVAPVAHPCHVVPVIVAVAERVAALAAALPVREALHERENRDVRVVQARLRSVCSVVTLTH